MAELTMRLEQYGLDAVQLVCYKTFENVKYEPFALKPKLASQIGSALRDAGKEVCLIGAYFNPVHSSTAKVECCEAIFKEYLSFADLLGGNVVGSETGSYNDDKWTFNPKNRTQQALQQVAQVFTRLCDHAASVGAYVGIEGAAGHVAYSPDVLRELIEMIGRKNIRVIFDLFNYLEADNHEHYIEILKRGIELFGNNILCFHLKDYIIENKAVKQVPIGQGIMDYSKILRLIKAHNMQARLVLEGTTGEHIVPSVQLVRRLWGEINV